MVNVFGTEKIEILEIRIEHEWDVVKVIYKEDGEVKVETLPTTTIQGEKMTQINMRQMKEAIIRKRDADENRMRMLDN